jgi:hypothetical protein
MTAVLISTPKVRLEKSVPHGLCHSALDRYFGWDPQDGPPLIRHQLVESVTIPGASKDNFEYATNGSFGK